MKKKGIAVIAMVVFVLAAIAALLGYRMMQQKQQVRDLLELGNQYLEEEQYEEAITAYKQLLAIEPKEETARENIVVAAVEWSDDLIEVHEYDKAEEVIADVYSIVPDERLETKRLEIIDKRDAYEKELLEIKKKEEERKQAVEQITAELSELAKICASGDEVAVCEYLISDEFQELIGSEYIEFDKKYETEYGALGFYEGGNYLYFGDYDGEIRSGNGVWYGPIGNEYGMIYAQGEWKDDKPNGEQIVYNCVNFNSMEGNVIDGVWNGEVEYVVRDTALYPNTPDKVIYGFIFHMGIAEVQGRDVDGSEIHSYSYGDGYAVCIDNTISHGIEGFAEGGYI